MDDVRGTALPPPGRKRFRHGRRFGRCRVGGPVCGKRHLRADVAGRIVGPDIALDRIAYAKSVDEVKTRPCMAALLPNEAGGYTCLVDTGATIDCTSGQLHQFAHLGTKLMKKMYGIENPKVGLLSNGAEPTKGNHLVKETFPILAEDKELNFVGNIEGNMALSGDCDVLVCDGFAGNQVLKNTEGMAKRLIKDIVILSKKRNKPEFMEVAQYLMKTYDISALGGGMVLGSRKLIIKARGNSDERAILNISKMLINYAKGDALLTKEQREEATR